MKSKNTIPKGLDDVLRLGDKAVTGALARGAAIPLVINTAPLLRATFYDLAGDPATPHIPGKQAQYAAHLTVVANAYAAGRVAVDAGRKFCQLAVSILKPVLGNQWNAQWIAAGFTAPSLEVPRDPVALLHFLRAYFNANPGREVTALEVSAATAQFRLTVIEQSKLAITQAIGLRATLKKARDAALAALRKRLSGLRAELDQLLEKTDGLWYAFGFHRPVDGRKPAPVKELNVEPVGPGAAHATWKPAALAGDYRVEWKIEGSSDPAVSAGLFADLQATLIGLPIGARIIISVTARNRSGETAPIEAAIVVA